jgi:hypothetical protein
LRDEEYQTNKKLEKDFSRRWYPPCRRKNPSFRIRNVFRRSTQVGSKRTFPKPIIVTTLPVWNNSGRGRIGQRELFDLKYGLVLLLNGSEASSFTWRSLYNSYGTKQHLDTRGTVWLGCWSMLPCDFRVQSLVLVVYFDQTLGHWNGFYPYIMALIAAWTHLRCSEAYHTTYLNRRTILYSLQNL